MWLWEARIQSKKLSRNYPIPAGWHIQHDIRAWRAVQVERVDCRGNSCVFIPTRDDVLEEAKLRVVIYPTKFIG
jgi:hypothetical protein